MKRFSSTIDQILLIPGFFLARLFSLFYRRGTLFLIMERGNDARDNGFCFFEYVKEKHPEIEAYYAITKDSPDRARLTKYGRSVVNCRSFRHYLIYCRASHVISTHTRGYNKYVSLLNLVKNQKHVFLQHGITYNYIPDFRYSNTRVDLFVCGAEPEYQFIKSGFGYPDGSVRYTGFCRYDKLQNFTTKRQILLMPTWRKWLNKRNFTGDEYFKRYSALLSDERLLKLLGQYELKLIFYPHHEMQPFVGMFDKCRSDNVIIASKSEYDVQTLLKESLLLITDYSSVFFDFAYMHKPLIYYQFDRQAFRRNHYREGYFSYDDGFGPVAFDDESLIGYVEECCRNKFKMMSTYEEKADSFFLLRDSENCKRVFDSVMAL